MKQLLAQDLFTVAGVLSAEECAGLIDRGETLGFDRASVRTSSGPQMRSDIRNNDRVVFSDPALAGSLWQRIQPFVPDPLQGGRAVGLDAAFRIYRYDPSQRFKRHIDGVVSPAPGLRSRLTFMVYLNDGCVGGDTTFYAADAPGGLRQEVVRVSPEAGTGLFFLHEWWHEGGVLLEGRKYVLRSDVFYRFPADG